MAGWIMDWVEICVPSLTLNFSIIIVTIVVTLCSIYNAATLFLARFVTRMVGLGMSTFPEWTFIVSTCTASIVGQINDKQLIQQS